MILNQNRIRVSFNELNPLIFFPYLNFIFYEITNMKLKAFGIIDSHP